MMPRKHHVAKPDKQIDLTDTTECGKDLHADGRPHKATDQQHRAHPQVHRLSPEMRQNAREGGGDDLVRLGRDGHGGGNADEEQKRRHQEPATDAEHARQDADDPAQAQQKKRVYADFCDGEVDLHGASGGVR
jgi:hypothetical protein